MLTILMGADISHFAPAHGSNKRPSFASLCSSMDVRASRYAISIRVQPDRAEIIVDLTNMMKELLKVFYQTSDKNLKKFYFTEM
ncbi:piwi domain-containing protein [Rhizophagus clarus]|uniref:Piwi domain-containing protein n=1 Tax=Rhizophagus clarus TaxID=94130 RepID=A0A8H3QL79_9GLOM|nr:piwi domain-containing protein [Rhizophagus clarus]